MIRLAEMKDMEHILTIFENARKYMREQNNPNQWNNGHPAKTLLEQDIEKRQLYVYEEDNEIHGVFMFLIGEDPTYAYIEGNWFSNETYGVIHRVASSGKMRGVMDKIVKYGYERINHLRIDTHEDNIPMQKALDRNGFKKCGIIYLENGDPRIAYEKC